MMFFLSLESTPAPPRGKAYRGSSLPSSHLQAKGSERSFTAERREPERKSRRKRRYVGTPDSSSGPCVLNLAIEPKLGLWTTHFWAAAKVMHRGLRGANGGLSWPSVHNFGRAIRRRLERPTRSSSKPCHHREGQLEPVPTLFAGLVQAPESPSPPHPSARVTQKCLPNFPTRIRRVAPCLLPETARLQQRFGRCSSKSVWHETPRRSN